MASRVSAPRLSSFTTKAELTKIFSRFGEVKEAHLIVDSITQWPKGFGFVTLQSEDEAKKAIKGLNGRIIAGRLIFVEPAYTEEVNKKQSD